MHIYIYQTGETGKQWGYRQEGQMGDLDGKDGIAPEDALVQVNDFHFQRVN